MGLGGGGGQRPGFSVSDFGVVILDSQAKTHFHTKMTSIQTIAHITVWVVFGGEVQI